MSQSPDNHERLLSLIGVSQEYIDRVREGAEERRAWRHANKGPTPEFFYESSETDFGDAPLSPPRSPPPQTENTCPDLSRNTWKTRMLRDFGLSIGPEKTGFSDYEVWKRLVLSEHAKSQPKLSTKPKIPFAFIQVDRSASRKKHRSATLTSEPITRSKASASSLFYELDHDGKISKPLLHPSPVGGQKGYRSSDTKNQNFKRKARALNRVCKR